MFSPSLPLLEVLVRGTLLYFTIFILLRIIRREAGSISVADVLVLVLVADAAQNGMAGEYTSITEGALLVLTIVGWSTAVDWAGYHNAAFGRLLHPSPVELVKDGVPQRRNMRRNLITHEELMTSVRQAGAEELREVRYARLEGNGEISVVLEAKS
jgi:uncharacterized membrane protein YcaP (DUF421 family)